MGETYPEIMRERGEAFHAEPGQQRGQHQGEQTFVVLYRWKNIHFARRYFTEIVMLI